MELLESIDIRATPEITLHAEGPHEQMQTKVEAVVREADRMEGVTKARAVLQEKTERIEKLNTSRDVLRSHAAKSEQYLRDVARLDEWIEAAAGNAVPDGKVLSEVGRVQAELTVTTECIKRIDGALMPRAVLMELSAEANHHEARAQALDSVARARAERVAQALQSVTNDEVALKFDVRTGVVGQVLELAGRASYEAERKYVQMREWAEKHPAALED